MSAAPPFNGWTRNRTHAVDPVAWLRRTGDGPLEYRARAWCGTAVTVRRIPVQVSGEHVLTCQRCLARYRTEFARLGVVDVPAGG